MPCMWLNAGLFVAVAVVATYLEDQAVCLPALVQEGDQVHLANGNEVANDRRRKGTCRQKHKQQTNSCCSGHRGMVSDFLVTGDRQ